LVQVVAELDSGAATAVMDCMVVAVAVVLATVIHSAAAKAAKVFL
jgi:hypothetical protein